MASFFCPFHLQGSYYGKWIYLYVVILAVTTRFIFNLNICSSPSERHPLPNSNGAVLTIGPVKDTEYKDRSAVVNRWGKFYLPKPTKMEVIGYMEGTSYPFDQLVLMTCEDQKVYGFDGEDLHLVAFSLDQMFTEGIADPALQSYYRGEAFKDMVSD
uniref:Uncharacterized protein n=1 Tax=Poecilia mexicana TaxID=48701 RepID=A0A3B3XP56_9TELE